MSVKIFSQISVVFSKFECIKSNSKHASLLSQLTLKHKVHKVQLSNEIEVAKKIVLCKFIPNLKYNKDGLRLGSMGVLLSFETFQSFGNQLSDE